MIQFVHVPKTGGHSICAALSLPYGVHRRASELPGWRFAFVRHPADRILASWSFITGHNPTRTVYEYELPKLGTFEQFILGGLNFAHECFRTMVSQLDAPLGFLGRFESLHSDFDKLCALLNVRATLPHENRSLHAPWQEVYTPPMLRVVHDLYADDFREFGYA